MTTDLDPDGRSVYVGEVVLRTPGLRGTAEFVPPSTTDSRGPSDGTEQFFAALDEASMSEAFTLRLSELEETTDGGGSSRGRSGGAGDAIELEVPAPTAAFAQVMLYVAEDGTASWHLPEAQGAPGGGTRSTSGTEVYRIPRAVVPAVDTGAGGRGILSAVGEKILKFIVFPLIDPVIGAVGDFFAGKWERRHRRTLLRPFTPDAYRDAAVDALSSAGWARMSAGPALLFIHGTFAQSHTAFRRMPTEDFRALSGLYADRVFAFDHLTVSVSPTENARRFAELIPADADLTVDVIAHSRGGLVAREISERGAELGLGPRFRVRTLVMVGTPNAGTALAQRKNLGTWLDRMTNLVQLIPDNPVTDTLSMVLTVLKQLALSAFGGLDGLTSMDPDGDYLAGLNSARPHGARYRAVAADFAPPSGSKFASVLRDRGVDLLFGGVRNDVVVPTDTVAAVTGFPDFRVEEPLVIDSARAVDHSSYFAQDEVNRALRRWLAPPR